MNRDFLIPVLAMVVQRSFNVLSLRQGSEVRLPVASNSSGCTEHMLSLAFSEWPNESFICLPCKEKELLQRKQKRRK